MIDSGLLDPASMITRRAPLAETPAEIERLATDPGDDVKVLIEVAGLTAPPHRVVPFGRRATERNHADDSDERGRRDRGRADAPHGGLGRGGDGDRVAEVAVGDEVGAEQAICAIATDKVDTEVVAPAAGVLAKQLVAEGANVAVGAPLAELTVGADAAASLEAAGGAGEGSRTPLGEVRLRLTPRRTRRVGLSVRRTPPRRTYQIRTARRRR